MGAPPPPPPEPPARMAEGGPMFMRNEPNIFSIDADIANLTTEYDTVVRNKEFARAQQIADQIDQLQQQKIALQIQKQSQKKPNTRFSELDFKILMDTGQGYAGIARDMGLEGVPVMPKNESRNEIDSILNRIKIR